MGFKLKEDCAHLRSVSYNPKSDDDAVCEDCLSLGDNWVHLRICEDCHYVGCCDSSKNKHATAHFRKTKHPVIQSAEKGEKWAWCYEHEQFKKLS